MALYGYARVSTSDQDLTLQTQILRAAGCEIIRAEKASGSGRTGRSELQLLLEFLRPGDTLMVTGTVAKLAMRQPFVLFKGLTFQKLCLPGAFRPGDHHN
ncbi:recombinase family protein, partial [Salmonella enterica subsp. enterica]